MARYLPEPPPRGGQGVFIHPFSDPNVMAGNAVAGLEILEDLPDVDAVLVPWGGGGLCCGIASAIKALRPQAKVFAVEIETGAPLAPALAAGKPVEVPFTPNFVDGIGTPFVNLEMSSSPVSIDGALVVNKEQTAAALRLVVERNRVVPEGAAATSVAAALAGMAGGGKMPRCLRRQYRRQDARHHPRRRRAELGGCGPSPSPSPPAGRGELDLRCRSKLRIEAGLPYTKVA